MGLNTIQTYIAWNYHETVPGRYFFEGQKDLVKFIELAQQQDLLVILRPGPYICAEWDYGGFPAWIYSMCKDKIRTSDATYMKLVDRWFKNLFPRLEHLLYENGGPVIAFQVENEYGSYGCDHEYMNNMVDLLKKYVPSSLLFTTDGASDGMVKCGSTNRTYTTVDFGPGGDPSHSFDVQRKFQPKGPLVNSEFYTGWLDHWGEKHHRTSADLVASSLDKILALNASVNLYMFIGGTNFNMMSGANMGGDGLQPITSSYDYDAPISEAGDPTEKYWKLQKVISKYTAMPPGPQPKPSEKLPYMKVPLASSQSLFDVVSQLPANVSKTPQPFAWLDLAQGWILYEVDISGASGNDLILDLGAFSDRASVFVDKKFQGILNAKYGSKLVIEHGQTLDLFVENEGRIGYSHAMVDASKLHSLTGYPLNNERSFTIDYEHNTFLKDGKPFRYISGSMHYFRTPHQLWEDRFYKAKMAGLNVIQTYVAWNMHEMFEDVYHFENDLDIVSYIKLAQQYDLMILLRPGPYIDSEWEYGGFPYWMNNKVGKLIRTSDQGYLNLVDKWFSVLLPKVKPLLYENGGPIIGVQVENEYGSYGCDEKYMLAMEQMLRKYLGQKVFLYTTDPIIDQALQCGSISSLYRTVDFGAGHDVNKSFALQRKYQPKGPYVNSEYYTGWFDNWGEGHHVERPEYIAHYLDQILSFENASVNLYLFEGGSNRNFMNGGSYIANEYLPITTSYDFDAPLSEAGDPTEKYWQIQKVISKYERLPSGPQPEPTKKLAYRKLRIYSSLMFFVLEAILQPIILPQPASFERLDLAYGYMLYQIFIDQDHPMIEGPTQTLNLGVFRDRAYVYVDMKLQGILERNGDFQLNITIDPGHGLQIIVENEGRTCFSEAIQDVRKGLLSGVILSGAPITGDWEHFRYGIYRQNTPEAPVRESEEENHRLGGFAAHRPFDEQALVIVNSFTEHIPKVQKLFTSTQVQDGWVGPPALYGITFVLEEVADTYLKLDQWGKGFATINEDHYYKYWTSSIPQKTIFIPKTNLKVGNNTIVLTEFERAPSSMDEAYIELVEKPVFV
uniref:Beta-galactosidase n=2 Tax=Clytia hemisphaerica TaxID=252671 RepID=A0A7M5WZQ4_9CNID